MSRTRDRRLAAALVQLARGPHASAALASSLALLSVSESLVRFAGTGNSPQFVLVLCLLALASTAPLGLLRPAPAAIACGLAGLLSLAPFASLTGAGAWAVLLALHRLGRHGSQLLAACVVAPYLVLALAGTPASPIERFLCVALSALAPAAAWAGVAQRFRDESVMHQVQRRAVDGTVMEHTARGERARIARELHDVVAHHVSMIAVQAETARLTTPGMPAAGAQRLSAIGDTARTALTEMRRLLGVLREDADTQPAQRAPQPGMRQLNDLLDEVRAASGTGARLIVRGSPDVLEPGVELAVYRIVQEALTNTRRHAPGAAVDVELLYSDGNLRLRIRDNGPGVGGDGGAGAGLGGDAGLLGPQPATGHGLLGMSERAVAAGGRLRSGRATGGGFLVEAVLPVAAVVRA